MASPTAPLLLCVPLCLSAAGSCAGGQASAPLEAFDQARAWRLLEAQVAIGPRPMGTPAIERTRALIEADLKASGLEPQREPFTAQTPEGEMQGANVYADLAGDGTSDEWIFLASHYDTKRMPEGRFVGANDGASSTAVVLELARVLARGGKRPLSYRFLFLDGEESVRWTWIDPDNRYGARHHAQRLKESGLDRRVRAFILLDLVGDKDLVLQREPYSDRRLLEDVFFAAARRLDLGRHVGGPSEELVDDHRIFMNLGIPSIDLFDFRYGPDNAWWHTEQDVPENCSAESLGIVGRIVLAGLPDVEQRFTRRR